MSVKYRLVLRKDMTKGAAEDSKLYYASSSSMGMCSKENLCEIIADRSAATPGDVNLVLDGLLFVVKQKLSDGLSVQLGDLGYFQAYLGSAGAATRTEFTTELVRQPRIVFRPGKALLEHAKTLKVERMALDKLADEKETVPTEPEEDEPVVQ